MKKELELLHVVLHCLVVTVSAGSHQRSAGANFSYPLPEAILRGGQGSTVILSVCLLISLSFCQSVVCCLPLSVCLYVCLHAVQLFCLSA